MALEELAAVNEAVKLPANLMGLLRESYDSRQKVLDWLLAGSVAVVCVWAFWPQLTSLAATGGPVTPNQDVDGALPSLWKQPLPANVYTYNMPSSRRIRDGYGPSGTRTPFNPSSQPDFPSLETN